MNYKETLYFVAKCLTISLEQKNRDEIEFMLTTTDVDWDAVVKVSTGHYVFPALYCNLQRAGFLHYLPEDLVAYMAHITQLNRDRNEHLIVQAKELNALLLANNITPIFLKGTGNMVAGIYEDIAERMVGDIDFIFSNQDYPKAIRVLREFGYVEVVKKEYYQPEEKKHYARLHKAHHIAAVEIHSAFLEINKYTNEFNYHFVAKDSQVINGVRVLSDANKLNLSIIANQINDDGFYYKTMALRNAYDVFLLSKKTSAKEAVNSLNKLSHPLNCFLAACYEVFNQAESLAYTPTKKVDLYLRVFNNQFNKPIRKHSSFYKIYIFIKRIFYVLYKSITHTEYRVFLFKCLNDKNWYKEKCVQLGFKK